MPLCSRLVAFTGRVTLVTEAPLTPVSAFDLPRDHGGEAQGTLSHSLREASALSRLASEHGVSDAAAALAALAALLWHYGARGAFRLGVETGAEQASVVLPVAADADFVALARAAERALHEADAGADGEELQCGVVADGTGAPLELALAIGPEPSVRGAASAFSAERLAAVAAHLDRVLAQAAHVRRLADIDVVPPSERRRLLVEWNDTAAPVADVALPALVAYARYADRVAVTDAAGASLTYGRLEQRVAAVASRLRAAGARPGTIVGVGMPRTVDLPVVLLGVLESGAAYLPLDPAYPADRIGFMLDDSRAGLVVADPALVHAVAGPAEIVIAGPELWQEVAETPTDAPRPAPNDLAYVIYTSGSTGRPKGVGIEHRNAVAFLSWATSFFGPELLRSVLATTSVCFDLSVFELFAPLACGGRVVLLEDATALLDLPADVDATLANSVPSVVRALLEEYELPPSLQAVNLAGEPLPRGLVAALYARGVPRVYNLYGPSEATTYSTSALVERDSEAPPIGRPIANTKAYVLDERLRPAPIGIPGELYLGGAGVARGYLGRPELTAERFLPDPFGPGGRIYRTGDVVRYLPDGRLSFLGRRDDQLKIRGFRVELGEIEHVLAEHPSITSAAVIASGEPPRLAAFVAPGEVDVADALEFVRRRLPHFMVPQRIVAVERIPLSPNGKIDHNRMQELAAGVSASADG
jgi:amino acid adenylation domain-containing protein